MKGDSGVQLKNLKVDGGMTNGDLVMQIQADIGGFDVVRPEMRECVIAIIHPRNSSVDHMLLLCSFVLTIPALDGVAQPRSTALGSALLAGSAIRLFGWDVSKPETLDKVNTKGGCTFKPNISEEERAKGWKGWQRAVEKSKGWEDIVNKD
jgi:glycerol kinase